MMPPAAIEQTSPEPSTASAPSISLPQKSVGENRRRFSDLRGVQWRIDLGILPSSSIDDLRRLTADSRRRYAALRRCLLVDPHIIKDGSNSPDLIMDNPLSQNPDSMWGRFFRNAELEKMLDQDLSRLYPEHGSYFQTSGCQGMLRRILLLWCLRHPEYGYRQGMHELLAPLLYVLHVDVEHLSDVRKLYEDHFTDKFDGFSFHESDLTYHFDFKKNSESIEDEIEPEKSSVKISSLDELDPKIRAIVLLSDAYGAEGELGIVLSEKFMEHDAYSMFDALMSGAGGSVAMAEFFSPALGGSHTGLPPVIEASSAMYHLLSTVDLSLHSHLLELGVEPQYFALRWFRVLFGREFSLPDLLIIWDEIFESDNSKLNRTYEIEAGSTLGLLSSPRGAFISAIAVSMILYLRSSLLATEHATSCLQRLLNFPVDIDTQKLIMKAKSLQAFAMDANNSTSPPIHSGEYSQKSMVVRAHSLSAGSTSPRTPLSLVPESYWEEKWRVLHKAEEELKQEMPIRKKGWSEKMRLNLSRSGSAPSTSKVDNGNKYPKLSVKRSLLNDLSQQLGSEEDEEKIVGNDDLVRKGRSSEVEVDGQDGIDENLGGSEHSSVFSDPASPLNEANDREHESERSSVGSNLSLDENDVEANNTKSCETNPENSLLPLSVPPEEITLRCVENNNSVGKTVTGSKEKKVLSGKLQWLWKFGRNGGEGPTCDTSKTSNGVNDQNYEGTSSIADEVSLRNLGQSMLENIQVIESIFRQNPGQMDSSENHSKNVLVDKGQVTAMAALKELRKLSNLLSEM